MKNPMKLGRVSGHSGKVWIPRDAKPGEIVDGEEELPNETGRAHV